MYIFQLSNIKYLGKSPNKVLFTDTVITIDMFCCALFKSAHFPHLEQSKQYYVPYGLLHCCSLMVTCDYCGYESTFSFLPDVDSLEFLVSSP